MTTWRGRTCIIVDGRLLMSAKKQPGNFDTYANHPGGAVWMVVPETQIDRIEQKSDGNLYVHVHGGLYVLDADPADGGQLKKVDSE